MWVGGVKCCGFGCLKFRYIYREREKERVLEEIIIG